MRIEEHKSISINHTFSLTEKEFNGILKTLNKVRADDEKFTHIKSITLVALGEDTRENIHLDISVRTKQGIPR